MIEFGKTLRAAREAKGYTVSQLAEATRLMHQVVEDLENENFTRIPAPIYGRGFVKLYCEAVGLDSAPLIAEYMAIQSGSREATIRIRNVEPAADATSEADAPTEADIPKSAADILPPPVAASPLEQIDDPLFSSAQEQVPPRTTIPRPAVQPSAAAQQAPASDALLPRARREFRLPEMNLPPIPHNTWRIAAVAAAAILLIWGVASGVRAIYRATMTPPTAEKQATASEKPTQAPKTDADAKKAPENTGAATAERRKPLGIPPLYID